MLFESEGSKVTRQARRLIGQAFEGGVRGQASTSLYPTKCLPYGETDGGKISAGTPTLATVMVLCLLGGAAEVCCW